MTGAPLAFAVWSLASSSASLHSASLYGGLVLDLLRGGGVLTGAFGGCAGALDPLAGCPSGGGHSGICLFPFHLSFFLHTSGRLFLLGHLLLKSLFLCPCSFLCLYLFLSFLYSSLCLCPFLSFLYSFLCLLTFLCPLTFLYLLLFLLSSDFPLSSDLVPPFPSGSPFSTFRYVPGMVPSGSCSGSPSATAYLPCRLRR